MNIIYIKKRRKAAPWTPAELSSSTLRLWLKADAGVYDAASGGNLITSDDTTAMRWEDQSGTLSLHPVCSSTTGAPKWRTNVLNGLPVMRFSGSRGMHRASTPIYSVDPAEIYVFAVYRDSATTAKTQSCIDIDNYEPVLLTRGSTTYRPNLTIIALNESSDTSRYTAAFNLSASSWNLHTGAVSFVGKTVLYQLNGGAVTWSTTRQFNGNSLGTATKNVTVGNRYQETGFDVLIGDIAEIVLTVNDDTDNEKIEGYLAHKWGLESLLPSTHTYKNAAP
jgi:hypothetical protein